MRAAGGMGNGNGGRKLVLYLLVGDIEKETLTIIVNHISQPSNRTHTSVASLLTCVSFKPSSLPNTHHIA